MKKLMKDESENLVQQEQDKISRYKTNYRYLAFEIYNLAKICTKC